MAKIFLNSNRTNVEESFFSNVIDRFSKETLANIIRNSGYDVTILNEEYFKALEDNKNNLV